MAKRVVDVLVPVALDQAYSYRVPDGMELAPGDVVCVPLGARAATAVVWADNPTPNPRLDNRLKEIDAMISHPQYDPNRLAAHDQAAVVKAWDELNADPNQPLVNRAIAGNLYPPGSVFKIVTASAALENGKVDPTTQIPAPGVMELPQTTAGLPNYDRQPCGPNNQTTLQRALEISCNTAFGYLGMQVGAQALGDQAAKFGFGSTLRIPTRVEPSRFPTGINEAQTAQSAIGQYDVRVTPLQVAMVSAGIANGGVVMKPYIINQVLSADLQTLDRTAPEQLGRAVSSETASTLTADAHGGRRPGHRHPGPHQRRQGGRQDRHRRAGERQAAARLVHRLRPGERPQGRRRGRGRGRRQRRERGRRGAARRPDRQSRHGSRTQPMSFTSLSPARNLNP